MESALDNSRMNESDYGYPQGEDGAIIDNSSPSMMQDAINHVENSKDYDQLM